MLAVYMIIVNCDLNFKGAACDVLKQFLLPNNDVLYEKIIKMCFATLPCSRLC